VRAALARAAVPTYPDLPTGVGFCFYIRRALIDAIGTFDPAFGLGYGEENDFCLRAVAAGFRNVLCDDAFVLHLGGRSFEGQKATLGPRNLALLQERHPQYLDLVRDYIAADPLRPIRGAAQAQQRVLAGPARGVLHVIHGHGGGTEHHARALIDVSRQRYRHYLAFAVDDAWQLEEHLDDGGTRTFEFRRAVGESWPGFVGGLCATFGIDLVHLHNITGCRDGIVDALAALDVPYGYTVHDFNFACPTILFLGVDGMYCGAVTDPAVCGRCLAAQPAFASIDIVAWRVRHRALLAHAAFLIAPSQWAAQTLRRYYPEHAIDVIPHGAPGVWAMESAGADDDARAATPDSAKVPALPDDGVPAVAVLGAVGPDKGARRLERMVDLVRSTGARVRFVLIGYLDVQHGPWQSDDAVLTVHGRYDPREAWAAGRPVVVPPFGALGERVAGTGAGWLWTDDEWRDEARMLARIAELVASANDAALAAASECARRVPQATLAAMVDRTLARYDAAMIAAAARSSARAVAPLDRARVRDALGYLRWTLCVPAIDIAAPAPAIAAGPAATGSDAAPDDFGARVASAALRWRHTLPGRVLYRLMPARLRDALKDRLP
jgi:glycosyltransferase involved in cell wall biosynthesis